jgi:hypothetical protein
MRRQILSIMFAGLASSAPLLAGPSVADDRAARASAPIAVQRPSLPLPGVRDEVAMVLVGTALIGLAAAVRRN